MNEIEKAIAVIGNPSHWNDEAWNQGAIQSAKDTAITALREQAERNKGCVWCKEDNKVTHNGEHFCFFCSYCGKRLR